MNRPARPGERRSINAIREGAESGVAQVLTPAETLAILDRLADAERVEQIAQQVADWADDHEDAVIRLLDALAHRKTQPDT